MILLDTEVQVQHVQGVQQLALVLVQALDLHVEDGIRVDHHTLALGDPLGKVALVSGLDFTELLHDALVGGVAAQFLEIVEVGDPGVTTRKASKQRRQARVNHPQPAARRNTVGLVVELLRPQRVPIAEGIALDDLRVQRGHAVDGVRGIAGDPRHVHHTVLDRGHSLDGDAINALR